ncbi:IS3 family transposase [Lactococcus petauri]|uniref:IS3 family transposase n=1 Tax=Lactococcus petauri TaxID=1940789 RepID=UPI003851ED0B
MVINEKRVLRLNILVTNFHHKSRKYKSYRSYVGRVAKHLIRKRFETTLTHQKITTDTTGFKYYEELKQWIHYYNTKRVKKKLGGISPIEYR